MSNLQTYNVRRDTFSKSSSPQIDRSRSTVADFLPFVPAFPSYPLQNTKSVGIVCLDNWNNLSQYQSYDEYPFPSQFPSNAFHTSDTCSGFNSKSLSAQRFDMPPDTGSNLQSDDLKPEQDLNSIPTTSGISNIISYNAFPAGNFICEPIGSVHSTAPVSTNYINSKPVISHYRPVVIRTIHTPSNTLNVSNFNNNFLAGNYTQHLYIEEVHSEDGHSETNALPGNSSENDEKDGIFEAQIEDVEDYMDDVPARPKTNKTHEYVHGKGLVDDNGVHKAYSRWLEDCFNDTLTRSMVLSDIYDWFRKKFRAARTDDKGWMNSIRHNLSMNKAFDRKPRPSTMPGKGSIWFLTNEAQIGGIKSTTRYRKTSSLKKKSKRSRSSKAGDSSPSKSTQRPRRGAAKRTGLSPNNSNSPISTHSLGPYNPGDMDYSTNQFTTPSPMTASYSSNDGCSPEVAAPGTPYQMLSPAIAAEAREPIGMPVVPSQRDNPQVYSEWGMQPNTWPYRD